MINIHANSASGSTYSQQVIKDRNSTLLFNMVRKMAPISRADLSRHSGLSPATVTVLTDELIQTQWLCELPVQVSSSHRGRRPIQLEVNASRGFVVTVDIWSGEYICTLYDICLNRIDSALTQKPAASAKDIHQSIVDLACGHGVIAERLLGVHVLFPGLFDSETGQLGFSTVISEENMVQRDLIRCLKELLPQVHIMISNNSTAMAYSVFAAHAPQVSLPLLAIAVNEGLGAGIVRNGDSDSCQQLEAGHIIISQDGPLCKCGNYGCLETYCSTTNLLETICKQTNLQLDYEHSYSSALNQHSMLQVAQAYLAGQEDVVAVIQEYAYRLCCGIVSIVNLMDIRSVYLGGILSLLGEPFLALMRQILESRFPIVTSQGTVSLALFDDNFESSRKAAVMLTLERLFQRS